MNMFDWKQGSFPSDYLEIANVDSTLKIVAAAFLTNRKRYPYSRLAGYPGQSRIPSAPVLCFIPTLARSAAATDLGSLITTKLVECAGQVDPVVEEI
jgi:hypothetical protein